MNKYRAGGPSKASATTLCQKCLKRGHYSYECTASNQERPYVSRPSRSQQFSNPKLAPKLTAVAPPPKTRPQAEKIEPAKETARSRKRSLDDVNTHAAPKRRRSVSSESSDSVSSFSTNRSASRSESRSPERRSNRSRSRSAPRDASPRSSRRRRNSSAAYDERAERTTERRNDSDRMSAVVRRPDRRPSPPPQSSPRGSHQLSPSPSRRKGRNRGRSRSRSRSPYRDHRRGSDFKGAERAPASKPAPPRKRSLSPYSQRIAMTRAANGT